VKKVFSVKDSASDDVLLLEVADNFLSRFRGLMGRRRLPPGQGLLLAPCSSVHMCFMRFSIDVVYLDRDYHILKIVRNLRPWIGLSLCPGAWGAAEFAAGEAERLGLSSGRQLIEKRNHE